jgi:LacI family transcriptional regulator
MGRAKSVRTEKQNKRLHADKVKRRMRLGSSASVKQSDVALLAKVSSGTVSRVLNQPHLVSPEAAVRVRAAIDQLGWVPHGPARALASNRTRIIGSIIPSLANPNIAEMTYGIQNRLMQSSYTLLIGCSEYSPYKALAEARSMVERGVDGLLLLGESFPSALWTLLDAQKVRFLITFSFRARSDKAHIGIDHHKGAGLLAAHLLDLGHKRFAVIAQEAQNNDRVTARLAGVLDVLGKAGIEIPAHRIVQKPWSMHAGYQAFQELVPHLSEFTALICINDHLAAGAMAAAHESGLRVPEDLSIVGFDNLDITTYLRPPLTTVTVPARALGDAAASSMLSWVEHGVVPQSQEFETKLIVRGSTGAPRGVLSLGKNKKKIPTRRRRPKPDPAAANPRTGA